MKANPACLVAGAGCALVINNALTGPYFNYVDDAGRYGPLVAAVNHGPRDGDQVKDDIAELPRHLFAAYPGIDRGRVYLVGFSAGSGMVYRGTCHRSKGYDQSPFGTTSTSQR